MFQQGPSSTINGRSSSSESLETGISMIAPAWTNSSLFINAPLSLYHRIAQDEQTLSNVTSILSNQNSLLSDDFQPSLAVIVTWEYAELVMKDLM